MSDVDTVWKWGGQTSTPQISKYLIRKGGRYEIRTRYHRAIVASVNSCTTSALKFSAQRSKKTRDFEKKISMENFTKIA